MQISGIVNVNTANDAKNQTTIQNLPFSDIAPGEKATAEVVAVEGRQITLKTADGTEVKTEFPAGTPVAPGDVVELMMVEKGQNMVHLKLSAINGQTVSLETNDLQVYLMKMGVQPSQLNQSAAELLVRHQVTPTPEKIAMLFEIAAQFPELPASVAVFMADNKVPPTQENVDAIMKWVTDPASFGKDVAALGEMIANADTPTANGQGTQATQAAQTASPQAGQDVKIQPDVLANALLRELGANATPAQREAAPEAAIRDLAARLATMEPEQALSTISEFVEGTKLPASEKQGLTLLLAAGYETATKEAAAKPQPGVQPEVVTRPASGAEQVGAEGKTQNAQNAANAEQNAAQMNAQAPVDAKGSGEARQLLNLLEKFFAPIKRDVPADAKMIEETLKGQQNLADTVKTGVARLMGEQSSAALRTNDLSAQARLGNQMDNFYYCQIPFQVNEEKNTAELYVFERNRGRKDGEAENVTVLIALETQNIGRVESVMRAAGEKLSVEFRVETDRIADYLLAGKDEFSTAMEQGGFQIEEVRVRRMDEPVTPLNAMKVLDKAPEVNIRGIDIQI